MRVPPPLHPGSRIALCSPAGIIRPQYVYRAVDVLRRQGWQPVVMPHVFGRCGTYAGTADERLADLRTALLDPTVEAILCTRGGYGAVQLLPELARLEIAPRWLVGFSDICALHALMYSRGIVSIHASMARRLAEGGDYPALFSLLCGEPFAMHFAPHPLNRQGRAQGRMVGGNLSVLSALISTPYDIFQDDIVLVLEDIAEPVYKVERIVWQLLLAGRLQRIAALVVGHFTRYDVDANGESMQQMLARLTAHLHIPIAYGAPIGHVDDNTPWLHGARVEVCVDAGGTRLRQV